MKNKIYSIAPHCGNTDGTTGVRLFTNLSVAIAFIQLNIVKSSFSDLQSFLSAIQDGETQSLGDDEGFLWDVTAQSPDVTTNLLSECSAFHLLATCDSLEIDDKFIRHIDNMRDLCILNDYAKTKTLAEREAFLEERGDETVLWLTEDDSDVGTLHITVGEFLLANLTYDSIGFRLSVTTYNMRPEPVTVDIRFYTVQSV